MRREKEKMKEEREGIEKRKRKTGGTCNQQRFRFFFSESHFSEYVKITVNGFIFRTVFFDQLIVLPLPVLFLKF